MSDGPKKPLWPTQEWVDPNGHALHKCILHEFDPTERFSAQAIVTLGGVSLCREHAKRIIRLAKKHNSRGVTLEQIIANMILLDLVIDEEGDW